MGSGVGLEAASIYLSRRRNYFQGLSGLMDNINKGRPLEKELRALLKKRRLMATRE